MTATLDWFVNNSGLNNIRFLVGEHHKNNEISSVNILDNPDVLKWFRKNELILTTGYIIKDDEQLQRQTVRELKETGCSALAIKIKRFFKTVPPAILDEAEKIDFPIIELPFFYSFSDISNLIFQYLYQEKQSDMLLEYDFIAQLMDACFQHIPVESLMQQFSNYLQLPVLLMDLSYKIIHIASTESSAINTLDITSANSTIAAALLEENSADIIKIKIKDLSFYFYKCLLDNHTGYLCFLSHSHDIYEKRTAFVHKIVQIISFACAQDNTLSLATDHGNFFMHFLLNNKNPKITELRNICHFYNFDYKKAWVCTTYSLPDECDKEKIITILKKNLKTNITDNIHIKFFSNYNLFSAFFFFAPHTQILAAVKKVNETIKKSLPVVSKDIHVGISSLHNKVTEISLSFEESLQAINNIPHHELITSYLHQLPLEILKNNVNEPSTKICKALIYPLIKYDNDNNTELLATLRIYIRSGFNSSTAAKIMYLHRNTMLKRLNKIKELLSIDFSNMNENFLLYMAIINFDLDNSTVS